MAFPSISQGKDPPPYRVPETEDTFYEMQHEISDVRHLIKIINIIHVPQDGRLLCYPVLATALGGEKNHRRAVLFMGQRAAIKTSHIRQCIVDIGIVIVGRAKRTHLGIIIFIAPSVKAFPFVLGFNVVGNKD